MSIIKPRKFKFSSNEDMKPYQILDNPLISTFYYSISIGFPYGERLMVETARHYLNTIQDPELKSRVRGFIGQESHHANATEEMNHILTEYGFDIAALDGLIAEGYDRSVKGRSWEDRLDFHCAFEHLTAVFSAYIVKNKSLFDDMPKNAKALMVWHCIEEIEHKDVVFDLATYLDPSRPHRRKVLFDVLAFMMSNSIKYQRIMLKQVNWKPNRKDIWGTMKFLFRPGGLVPALCRDTFKYLKSDFHPNDIDHTNLIRDWEKRFPDIAQAVS